MEYNQNNAFVIIKHLINLKRNSKLNFNIINDQKNYTLLTNVSLMEYNSELNFNSIYSNGLITRVKNYFYPGKNSKLNINDIVLGRNNEKFDIYSNIINNEKNVKSNLKAKAVV
ncbi:MAG: SufD family Fe-S cluster assembly protein, partial [Candidatus Micrarchaeaceae archaeon]